MTRLSKIKSKIKSKIDTDTGGYRGVQPSHRYKRMFMRVL